MIMAYDAPVREGVAPISVASDAVLQRAVRPPGLVRRPGMARPPACAPLGLDAKFAG